MATDRKTVSARSVRIRKLRAELVEALGDNWEQLPRGSAGLAIRLYQTADRAGSQTHAVAGKNTLVLAGTPAGKSAAIVSPMPHSKNYF